MSIWLLIYRDNFTPNLFQSAYFNTSFDLEAFIKDNKSKIVPVFTEQLVFRVELDTYCGHVKKYYQSADGEK